MPTRLLSPTRLAVFLSSLLGLSFAAGCDDADLGEDLQAERGGLTSLKYTLADFGDGAEDVSNSPRDLYGSVNRCDGARFWVVGEADNLAFYEADWDSSEGAIVVGPYLHAQHVGFTATINNGVGFFNQFNLDVPINARKLLKKGYHVEHVGLLVNGYSAYGRDDLLPGGHEQIYKARITARLRKGSSLWYTGIDWHEANLRLEMYGCELPTTDIDPIDIDPGDIGPFTG